jgi:hypothetical protein
MPGTKMDAMECDMELMDLPGDEAKACGRAPHGVRLATATGSTENRRGRDPCSHRRLRGLLAERT